MKDGKTKTTPARRGARSTSGERWTKYRETRAVVVAYLSPVEQASFKKMATARGLSMSAQLSLLVNAFINGETP